MSSLLAYLTTNEVISHEQAKKGFDRLHEVRDLMLCVRAWYSFVERELYDYGHKQITELCRCDRRA